VFGGCTAAAVTVCRKIHQDRTGRDRWHGHNNPVLHPEGHHLSDEEPCMHAFTASAISVVVASAVLCMGCGGGTDQAGGTTTPVSATDAHTTAAASIAVGAAADAGLDQLYSGGAIAMGDTPRTRTISDAPDTITEILHTVANAPPMPVTGSTTITTSSYTDPIFVSGQLMFEADDVGLPTNWFHVSLSFVSNEPFAIRDEDGDSASISSGTFDLYVHDQVLTNDNQGNWTRQVDAYASISASAPIAALISFSGGGTSISTLSGLRHVSRAISHTSSGSGPATIVRTDNVQIDGDSSGAVGIVSPALAVGPTRHDRNGASHPFTQWVQANQEGTGGTPTMIWNRFCDYTVTYTYPQGTVVWAGAISGYFENVYIQKNGGMVSGPYSDIQLYSNFGLLIDLNNGTQFF
jgi:hypothetical protein